MRSVRLYSYFQVLCAWGFPRLHIGLNHYYYVVAARTIRGIASSNVLFAGTSYIGRVYQTDKELILHLPVVYFS